jgi:hypothetical protein
MRRWAPFLPQGGGINVVGPAAEAGDGRTSERCGVGSIHFRQFVHRRREHHLSVLLLKLFESLLFTGLVV